MNQYLVITALFIALSHGAVAEESDAHNHQHNHHSHEATPSGVDVKTEETPATNRLCEQKITLHVKGLVCDFCARSIEKVFKKKKVASIDVDLGQGLIEVFTQPKQLLDDTLLTTLVNNSGYTLERIERGCIDE